MSAFQFYFLCMIFLYQTSQVHPLNILGIFPYPGKSHFNVHEVLLKELAHRGHNVTVISHYPQKTQIVNYHDIILKGEADSYVNWIAVQNPSYSKIFSLSIFLALMGTKNCKTLLSNESVQNIWKSERKFDVVITELFISDCALGLAYELDTPAVGITSHTLMPYHYNRFGVPQHPSYTPFQLLNGGMKTNFLQRIERTVFTAYFQLVYYLSQRMDQYVLGQYFNHTPPLEELGRNMKFLLLYEHFVLFSPYILPTNVISVGGFHVAEPKPLPLDLQAFIDDSEYGVVYISFGTMLKSSWITPERLDAIVGAIKKLPQRVIWKWDSDFLPIISRNVYISRWLPQNDILAHPNVVTMFSHCGVSSLNEAIHHGVPVIGMPVFGDQPRNAAAVEESGLGVQIQVEELTEDALLKKFEIVLNPMFREKVKWISKMWRDRLTPPLDTAVYWLEYAARYNNVTFRAAVADVPLYQFYCIDILLFFLLLSTILFFTIKFIVAFYSFKKKNSVLKNHKAKKR